MNDCCLLLWRSQHPSTRVDVPRRPLLFEVSSAADGCKATESTAVGPGMPPPGGGVDGGTGGTGSGGDSAGSSHGCKCQAAGAERESALGLGLVLALAAARSRRRRR